MARQQRSAAAAVVEPGLLACPILGFTKARNYLLPGGQVRATPAAHGSLAVSVPAIRPMLNPTTLCLQHIEEEHKQERAAAKLERARHLVVVVGGAAGRRRRVRRETNHTRLEEMNPEALACSLSSPSEAVSGAAGASALETSSTDAWRAHNSA